MKRLTLVAMLLLITLCFTQAVAQDMGVQPIGGFETNAGTVSLDDVKLNVNAELGDGSVFTPTSCSTINSLDYYPKGASGANIHKMKSGEEADYLVFNVDILNTTLSDINYLSDFEVKVIADDTYEFAGWAYQYDFDKNKTVVISEEDFFAISPMYTGHYVFGCTLPNAVVEGKTPLRMEIKLMGNEITYNVRK